MFSKFKEFLGDWRSFSLWSFSESFAVRCFLRKFDPSWIRHCERFCDDTQEVVAQAIGRMEIWRRDWEHSYEREHSYEKELKTTRKQMLRMKAQLEKHYRKIILMEVGEESTREKLEERENLIKELQERVRHLKLEKHPGFCRSEAFWLASNLCWLVWTRASSSQRRRHCGTALWASQESKPIHAVISCRKKEDCLLWAWKNKCLIVMMYFKSVILLGQFVRLCTSQIVNSSTRIPKIGELGSNYQHLLNILDVFLDSFISFCLY